MVAIVLCTGVTSANHWQTLENNWDLLTAFVQAPGMTVPELQQFREDICPYIVATSALNFGPRGAYPNMTFGQFTFNADTVQIAFSALAGAPSLRWTEVMRAILPTAAQQPNSGYMIAAGTGHCIIPGGALYSTQADGTRALDWLARLVNGDVSPQVVDCLAAGECNANSAALNRSLAVQKVGSRLADWGCAAAFQEYYTSAGLAMARNDTRHILKLFASFSAQHCENRQGGLPTN